MTRSDCIFCKIADGTIPAVKVMESESAVAFMDIGPLAEGHVLLIPRWHYETIDQVPAESASQMLACLPALVKAVRAATGCEGVNVLQNNGRAAHQLVLHVHFHIIPRKSGDSWHFNWPAGKYAPGKIEELAKAIKENLK